MFDLKNAAFLATITTSTALMFTSNAVAFDAEAIAKRFNEIGIEVEREEATPQGVLDVSGIYIDSDVVGLGDADIKLICSLPNLSDLSLDNVHSFTSKGLAGLADCQKLTTVSLQYVHVGDEGAAALAQLPLLEDVNMSYARGIADKGFAALAKSSSITRLGLGNISISNAGLASIAGMSQLEKLELDRARGFSSDAVKQLSNLKNLDWLTLDYLPIDDSVLEAFKNHPSLSRLEIVGVDTITDIGVGYLGTLPNLSHLDLDQTLVTGAFLEELSHAPLLENIWARETLMNDADVTSFHKFKLLSKLRLTSSHVGDGTMAQIAKISTMEDLNVSGTKGTSAGIKSLLTLPALKALRVDHTLITDAAFGGMVSQTIQDLRLSRTGVDDKLIAELAASWPELTNIDVSETLVTKEGVEAALAKRSKDFGKLRIRN